MVKKSYNLSSLNWTVTGYVPYEWHLGASMEVGVKAKADVDSVPAAVPGSVQKALLDAGVIPDWNIGFDARQCEWVENRHWLYEVKLPDEWFADRKRFRLNCLGLDYAGEIYLNGALIHSFKNSFVTHNIEITEHLKAKDNVLQIIFMCIPRWLGQFGHTSAIKDHKPRFNYTWDWTSRLVQIGIWDAVTIEAFDDAEMEDINIQADYDCEKKLGALTITGHASGGRDVCVSLLDGENVIEQVQCSLEDFNRKGIDWDTLTIEPWNPNGFGGQQLYRLKVAILDEKQNAIDEIVRRIGFKNVQWQACKDAPTNADPWICVVNGEPVFLQGVNWTPIRPNFADVAIEDYRKRLELYREMGCNLLRVWGGAFLEKQCFYDLCDELGLMVWQEFPLSSSGIENYPSEDPEVMAGYCSAAHSYIDRRHHHVSLLLWSGGNELTSLAPDPKPLDESHPLLGEFGKIVREKDPQHRFVATSPTGPEFFSFEKNYGKGVHWDVHGPWKVDGLLDEEWLSYWHNDDSLFRSEMGAPGPSSVELIEKYKGDYDAMPADHSNVLWRRTGWWVEPEIFEKEYGRAPESLQEYVQWGQQRQAKILSTVVKCCKDRFPACGGVLLWMGHDCFPCTANTSIIDFDGNPKPAFYALMDIFKKG